MVKMRKITSLILALVLCMSLAVTASAALAGIYIQVGGTGYQSGSNFITTTYVTKNPDCALLYTDIQFSDGLQYIGTNGETSSRGVATFSCDFLIYMTIDCIPNKAYCTHGVRGGTQSESGYAQYNQYSIDMT